MESLFGDEFQKGKGRAVAKRCTPAPCGSGPAGETCGTCDFLTRVQGNTAWYLKCGKMQAVWTRGAGSDVRAKWEACREWRREDREDVPF